jgi:hypothetical protein
MKLTIIAEFEEELDGHTGVLTLSRNEVETLQDLSFFYQMSATALGFTYVDNVGISKGNGDIVWSSF